MVLMGNAHEIPDPVGGIGSLMYQNGFGNQFGTQALEGALPEGATRRKGVAMACMPNSSQGPLSPHRGTRTAENFGAPGTR